MISLVGYTGFVGGNIYAAAGDAIDCAYNSGNIAEAYGTNPGLLIYSGLRAEKYLANNDPERDMEQVREAYNNILKINPKRLVLISTIDVFKNPVDVDEDSPIDTENLHAYGLNRYRLECMVREHYPDALIIRLPGLFGRGIKKNFIYDYINVIPFMLKAEKFAELSDREPHLNDFYEKLDNGFYRVNVSDDKRESLKAIFKGLGFSALNFTDSRSIYQFYDLGRLWNDINTALDAGITMLHPATEPVSAAEVYEYLSKDTFVNELGGSPAYYDYKTKHDDIFGGRDGYIMTKEQVLSGIAEFVRGMSL